MRRLLFGCSATLLFSILLWGCQPSSDSDAQAPTVQLRILHTSDLHGKLTAFDYFSQRPSAGLWRAAATIIQARQEVATSILIDNGDTIQGDPLADWAIQQLDHQPHPMIQAMNLLQYDVANLGNHEFNYGLPRLWQSYQHAEFNLLSSNIRFTEEAPQSLRRAVQPWRLLQRQVTDQFGTVWPLTIAVIGVVPEQIMRWDANHLQGRVLVEAQVSAVTRAIEQVHQQGADVVVIAAHTGIAPVEQPDHQEQMVAALAQIEGVDAIVFGHQHQVFPGTDAYRDRPFVDATRGTVHGVPAVSPGYAGSHIGQIDLDLRRTADGWQVSAFNVLARPVGDTTAASLDTLVANAHQATLAYVQQPVGISHQPLDYQQARWQPSSGVQFVQRAQLWYAKQRMGLASQWPDLPVLSAAAPFNAAANATEDATHIAAGALSLGAIGDLYRYPNSLDVVLLNGGQLRDWLEFSALAFNSGGQLNDPWSWVDAAQPHYNFDHIFGIEYQFDPTQAIGQRLVKLHYRQQPVSDAQQFLVLVNSYRSAGGGSFPHLDGSTIVQQSPDQLPDILSWYLQSLGADGYQHPVAVHWQLCPNAQCFDK